MRIGERVKTLLGFAALLAAYQPARAQLHATDCLCSYGSSYKIVWDGWTGQLTLLPSAYPDYRNKGYLDAGGKAIRGPVSDSARPTRLYRGTAGAWIRRRGELGAPPDRVLGRFQQYTAQLRRPPTIRRIHDDADPKRNCGRNLVERLGVRVLCQRQALHSRVEAVDAADRRRLGLGGSRLLPRSGRSRLRGGESYYWPRNAHVEESAEDTRPDKKSSSSGRRFIMLQGANLSPIKAGRSIRAPTAAHARGCRRAPRSGQHVRTRRIRSLTTCRESRPVNSPS